MLWYNRNVNLPLLLWCGRSWHEEEDEYEGEGDDEENWDEERTNARIPKTLIHSLTRRFGLIKVSRAGLRQVH